MRVGGGEKCYFSLLSTTPTEGLIIDVGRSGLGCSSHKATVPMWATLWGRLGGAFSATQVQESSTSQLRFYNFLGHLSFVDLPCSWVCICSMHWVSLITQSALSVRDEIMRMGIIMSSKCAFKFKYIHLPGLPKWGVGLLALLLEFPHTLTLVVNMIFKNLATLMIDRWSPIVLHYPAN